MASAINELNAFHQFAIEKLSSASEDVSLQDVFGMWQAGRVDSMANEDALAVRAAVRDLDGGDVGIPFDEHLRDMRKKHGLVGPAE